MREQDIWQILRRRSSVFAAARKNLEPITLQRLELGNATHAFIAAAISGDQAAS